MSERRPKREPMSWMECELAAVEIARIKGDDATRIAQIARFLHLLAGDPPAQKTP